MSVRFFYVRAEPSTHALLEFAKREHKPHKKAPLGFPVACVAYNVAAGGLTDEIEFAFSTHNPIDSYSRDAAKAWALYYLTIKEKNRGVVGWHSVGLIIKTRIMELLSLPGSPYRVQKAAHYWLNTHTKPTLPVPLKPSKVDAREELHERKGPTLVSKKRRKK